MSEVPSYSEGYINVKGYNLHYLEWGKTGKSMILLHGSAPYCSAHDLEAIGDALSDRYHIIAFDMIGHAQSDDPKTTLGFKEHVSILHKAAQRKGFEKATLIGWSFGGWLSMVWADSYPLEVEKVVLIDIIPVTYTMPTPQDPENTPASFKSEEEAVDFLLNKYTTLSDVPPRRYVEDSLRYSRRDEEGSVYPLSHHSRRLNLRKDLDLWKCFIGISVPILLIWGLDSMLPVEEMKRMKTVKRDMVVAGINDANHFVPVSHPEQVIKAINSFLTQNPDKQFPPLTRREPETLLSETGFLVDRNLAFATVNGRNLELDLFRPEKQEGALPVVVWIFGGAFRVDNKVAQTHAATWLIHHGYAVAVISYRLSGEALFPAQIHDCKAAVRWLRANSAKYNLDPEQIGVWGPSSGGYLSAMLGVTGDVKSLEGDLGNLDESSRVQAVVDFYGPSDFLKMDEARLPDGQWHYPTDSPESQLLGAPIQEVPEKVREANPITYVNGSAPPFFILHGTDDLLVSVNQSELLFAALKDAGVESSFFKLVGAGHGGPQFWVEQSGMRVGPEPVVGAMVLAFFNKHLKHLS
jgi:acetyl esterase/lipase